MQSLFYSFYKRLLLFFIRLKTCKNSNDNSIKALKTQKKGYKLNKSALVDKREFFL